MLQPIPEPKNRIQNFQTYDLEWYPSKFEEREVMRDGKRVREYKRKSDIQFRLAGVRHPFSKKYHGFTNKADFLNHCFDQPSGTWFYAHAGGLADVQFVLEELATRPDFQVHAAFSGSSATIVTVGKGNKKWHFLDSYWTLRAPLQEIGRWLGPGYSKGEVDWDVPMPILKEYNEQDNVILCDALSEFQKLLINQGSELRMTLASSAMRMIERRFLKKPITTSAYLNRLLRPAYVGGRVENFFTGWHRGYLYDINSCYPYVMTKRLPGRYIGAFESRPGRVLPDHDECAYIANITIHVPEDLEIPPLPLAVGGSLYFPVGELTGWFCGPEIELALSLGCTLRKVHECYCYEYFWDMADFANTFYNLRKTFKPDKNDERSFFYEVLKLLMNSGYGKYGERPEKTGALVNPTLKEIARLKDAHEESVRRFLAAQEAHERAPTEPLKEPVGYTLMSATTPNVFIVQEASTVAHAHIPIAAYVTSLARVHLYGFMTQKPVAIDGWQAAHRIAYCDTDSIATTDPSLPTSLELGDLKLDKVYREGHFAAPKNYYLELAKKKKFADGTSTGHITRAKGFSRICDCLKPLPNTLTGCCPDCGFTRKSRFLSRTGYEALIGGQPTYSQRMRRIRENFRQGNAAPTEDVVEKHVAHEVRSKRCYLADGSTRPWHIRELTEADDPRTAPSDVFSRMGPGRPYETWPRNAEKLESEKDAEFGATGETFEIE